MSVIDNSFLDLVRYGISIGKINLVDDDTLKFSSVDVWKIYHSPKRRYLKTKSKQPRWVRIKK
jgi:hypothetical protein